MNGWGQHKFATQQQQGNAQPPLFGVGMENGTGFGLDSSPPQSHQQHQQQQQQQQQSSGTSPSATSSAASSRRGGGRGETTQTITPLTIRMVLGARMLPGEVAFRIDNKEVTLAAIVGRIVHAEEFESNLSYHIYDGSGEIEVRTFSKDMPHVKKHKPEWQTGVYVRVFGHLRNVNNSVQLIGYRIEKIEDTNELTLHWLESVHTHLYNVHGPFDDGSSASQQPQHQPQQLAMGDGQGTFADNMESMLTEMQSAILNIILQYANHKSGASYEDIAQGLRVNGFQIANHELRPIVELLMNEGHIFNTLDANHFKPTSV